MADGADLHGKIYGWLTDLGYTVDSRDTRRESLDVGGVSKRGFSVNVIRDPDIPDRLIVFGRMVTTTEEWRQLGQLSAERIDRFIRTCKLDLVRLGVQAEGLVMPLAQWDLLTMILEEVLTKAVLAEQVALVARGTLLMSLHIQGLLVEDSPSP